MGHHRRGPRPLPDLTYASGTKATAQCLAVSPDGRWLVAGLGARSVARWDLSSGTPVAMPLTSGFPDWFNGVAFSADSTEIVLGDSDQKVRILDAATMAEKRVMSGPPAKVLGVGFAGSSIVASGAGGAVWTWPTQSRTLRSGGGTIYQLATDDAGHWLVGTSSADQAVYVWDALAGGRLAYRMPAPSGVRLTTAATMTADGKHVYSGSRDGEVVRWDLTASGPGTPTVQRALGPGSNMVSIAVDPGGTLLAATHYTGQETALLRIGPEGALTPLATLTTPTPQALGFDHTGRLLQIGISTGVQVWDLADPAKPVLASTLPTGAVAGTSAFAYKSAKVAVGSDDGAVSVYDVADHTKPRLLKSFHDSRSGIYSVTFTPDDSRVVAGGGDEVFYGWDLTSASDKPVFATTAHAGRTTEGRFVASGLFAGAGQDGSVRLWTLDADAARTSICANRGTPLAPDEWTHYLPGITPFDPCTGR